MGLDFDVLEFCRKLRTSKQPPYTCPVVECSKSYKSMCGLQYHLVNFDHNSPSPSDAGASTVPIAPVIKKGRKKGRGSHMKCTTPVTNDLSTTPTREGLTYAEAQKLVEFEINGKVNRVSIHEPLKLIAKQNFESNVATPVNSSGVNQYQGSVVLARSQEAVTKLPEPCFTELMDYKITDAPARPNAYVRFIERSAEELDGEVEYDMDEEDAAWLVIVNERRVVLGIPEVPIDTFELLMDRLEKESYFQMQTNKAGGSSTSSVIDDDAVCCICMDGECQNSNVILFCDMCNLAVHQDCYGVPYIPEGQWLCRRCLQSPSRAVDCVLCPNNGGAFKQTDRGHWAHVVCALWIPEVRFANTVFLEPIDSIETIPPARWKLTCYICKQRGVGACIQCHKTNCYSAFHVTCAQQAGLFMKMETVRDAHTVGGEPGPLLVQKTAFCDSHTPADAEARQRINTALAQPTISAQPASPSSPDDPNSKMKNARRLLAKKRSSVPVISIPTIPPDRIQEIGSLVSLPKKSQFITRLIAYWTLKRQFRNGVPLLRRLQSSHLARRDETCHSHQVVSDIGELYRQLKYWQCLRQDLERARLLCELVRKREKLKKEFVKVKALCTEVELSPLVSFLRGLVDLLRARDTGEIFVEPVDQSEVPDYRDVVKHPMDLSTMRSKVDDYKYASLDEFEEDFHLMIDNCLAYNAKDTVFYRAAIKMRDQGGALLHQARKDMDIMSIDVNSGPLRGRDKESMIHLKKTSNSSQTTPGDEANAAEIDKQLGAISDPSNKMGKDEIMCKLLQLLDSSQNLKHGLARAKRVKLVKAEISKLRKKMSDGISQQNIGRKDSTDVDADSSDEEISKKVPKTPTSNENTVVAKKRAIDESSILTVKRRRRKKTWDDFVEGPVSNKSSALQMSSSTVPVTPEKDSVSKPPAVTPSTQSPGNDAQITISPSGVNRRTAVLFTRKAAAATRQFRKPDMPSSPIPSSSTSVGTASRRRGRQAKRNLDSSLSTESIEETVTSTTLQCSDSFRVYRSGGEMKGESDEESRSDDETSCSICSSSDGSSVTGSGSGSGSDWSDSEESAVSGGGGGGGTVQEALEQLQLVWAKCRGYPWYPALIINPKMPRGYVHNGVPIPSPPADVLALANNYTEPVYLVLFFDTKRTWQWLPRNKLEPLGVTPELDQIKLIESRKPTDRKAVKKAYQEAMTHRTQVDKKEEPSKSAVTTVTDAS